MPRPAAKHHQPFRKRPAPAKNREEPSSDDDSPEQLTKDEQRALKRFKAGMDDDGSDATNDDSGPEEVDIGGGRQGDEEDETGEDEEEDDSDDSTGEGDHSDDDDRTLEEQVADVPFEVLEALRQDGRGLAAEAADKGTCEAEGEVRDPRFDSTSGPPPTDTFRRRYAFLYNESLPQEKSELQAKIKKEKNPKFKAQLQ
ncbi:hypothetical protein VOLCADRAFT_101143, partial [Volvox carteri f. nagariensis]